MMEAAPDRLESIRRAIIAFRDERDWAQFHDPKNLAQGLAIEAAELQEVFLWKTTDECKRLDPEDVARVREEVADVFLFSILVADAFGIDLAEAAQAKIKRNAEKYPVEKARGRRDKYTKL